MNLPGRQKGLGMAAWIVVMLIAGGITSVALTLYTPFYDFYLIEKVMDKLSNENGHANKDPLILTKMIRQRFKMNNVRNFDFKTNMTIKRTPSGTDVILDYEIRDNMWRNVDIISSFEKTTRLRP